MRKIDINLVLINGKIYTLDGRTYEAVAVSNNKIVKLGTSSEIKSMCSSSTQKIDLKGSTVCPGFNDSHLHLLNYGLEMNAVQLGGVKSVNEMISKGKKYIKEEGKKPGEWIIGSGWNQNKFVDKDYITKEDLDKISTQNPIYFTRICGHVAVVNSLALKYMGVKKDIHIKGGSFDKDEKGDLTGVLRENALDWVEEKMPKSGTAENKKAITMSVEEALKAGLTSVQTSDLHCFDSIDQMYDTYMCLKDEGKIRIRINEQMYLPDKDTLLSYIDKYYRTVKGDDFFKFGPLKLLTDGSLGGRTAALAEGYNGDPNNKGVLIYEQNELDDMVYTAHKNGMQVFLHAIGDLAIKSSIDAIEKAIVKKACSHRHRINHFQIGNIDLFNRMIKLGLMADIQPIFVSSDWNMVEDRVGKERAKFSYAWKTMMEMGIPLGGGSDCPVEGLNPLHGIYAAVTRKGMDGYPDGGWMPEQKLTLEETMSLFTKGSAYATFEEHKKGTITEGKLADMVVLSEDIFEVNENDIKDIEVEKTIVGGKIEYSKQ